MEQIVDTHCHFWTLATTSWLDASLGAIHRDYAPSDHRAGSVPVGVSRCVIVEAGPTDAENQLIIDHAAADDFVGGLILCASLDDPQLGSRLDEWQKLPKFRGIRHNFEPNPDPDAPRQPAIIEGLKELQRRDLVHEFLPRVRHLEALAETLEGLPDLRGIIEHYAKPDFDGTVDPAWEEAMQRIAADSEVFCKLSLSPQVELGAELASKPKQGWPLDALRPYTEIYMEEFGPDRLVWGSDWPVAMLTTDYAGMLETHRDSLGTLTEEDETKLFRTNAEEFYQVEA